MSLQPHFVFQFRHARIVFEYVVCSIEELGQNPEVRLVELAVLGKKQGHQLVPYTYMGDTISQVCTRADNQVLPGLLHPLGRVGVMEETACYHF